MYLSRLQSVIYFELSSTHRAMTGYDLTKSITKKGIPCSHQQVYRELNRMQLVREMVPQTGKPDKITHKLPKGFEPSFDIVRLPTDVLLAYLCDDLVDKKLAYLSDELELKYTNQQRELTEVEKHQASMIELDIEALSNHTI